MLMDVCKEYRFYSNVLYITEHGTLILLLSYLVSIMQRRFKDEFQRSFCSMWT